METKYCRGCDKQKDIKKFLTRIRKSGHIYICLNCKECEKIRKQQPKLLSHWYMIAKTTRAV